MRGVKGLIEARTIAFNNRYEDILRDLGGIYDEFAERVLSSRVEKYKEPELISKDSLSIAYKYYNPTRERYGIVIGIMNVSKATMEKLREYLKEASADDVKELSIIIYAKTAKKNLEDVRMEASKAKGIKIMTILHGGEYPMFNIMRHVRVPVHIILTEDEKYDVLHRYSVPEEDILRFPLMLEKDPVAKLIGAKSGDMILIIRKSETAGQAVYYRYVTKPGELGELERRRMRI